MSWGPAVLRFTGVRVSVVPGSEIYRCERQLLNLCYLATGTLDYVMRDLLAIRVRVRSERLRGLPVA